MTRLVQRERERSKKLKELGIDYEYNGYQVLRCCVVISVWIRALLFLVNRNSLNGKRRRITSSLINRVRLNY